MRWGMIAIGILLGPVLAVGTSSREPSICSSRLEQVPEIHLGQYVSLNHYHEGILVHVDGRVVSVKAHSFYVATASSRLTKVKWQTLEGPIRILESPAACVRQTLQAFSLGTRLRLSYKSGYFGERATVSGQLKASNENGFWLQTPSQEELFIPYRRVLFGYLSVHN
jgi:hypothetical protein